MFLFVVELEIAFFGKEIKYVHAYDNSDAEFIAIQNGCRSRWDTTYTCRHDIYLTFTNQEANLLNKLGWEIKEANNIGSLNAARVFATLKNQNFKNDLLIISCWRGNIEIDFDYLEQYKAMTEMHIFK